MKKRLWILFDNNLKINSDIKSEKGKELILIEGFWDNPNNFFRIKLLLESLCNDDNKEIIALLRKEDDRAKNTLISLGVREFIYLSDTPKIKDDYESASKLLKKVTKHKDLLSLNLPNGIPSFIFYDTALKLEKNPQPKINSEIWIETLAEVFQLDRFYNNIFSQKSVSKLIVSHPWKNEFGMLLTIAFQKNIDCYFLYSVNEMMRIKKINNFQTLLKSPYESISFKEYNALPKPLRESIINAGEKYIESRSQGINTDINIQKAYSNKLAGNKFLTRKGIPRSKPIVTVFCHAWYDFPHNFGMKNFTDFLDWTILTYKIALKNKNVTWIFKPHPTETWYGGFYLKDLIRESPNHIYIIDEKTSVETILDVTNSIITVHGTIAIEGCARGIPVIAADQCYYSDWNIAETMTNREEYINKLNNLSKNNKIITKEMKDKARAFAYLSLAPAEEEIKIKRLLADHLEPTRIFKDLIKILNDKDLVSIQRKLIIDWINSETENFCLNHKIKFHRAKIKGFEEK
tara:strand:- start:32 stop:1585 length:1554 start_codon:yes stop_codon:yes gene_type:complete